MEFRLVEKPEGHLEYEPRPSPDDLAAYYRDKYFGANHGHTPYAHGYTPEELEHKRLQPAETEHIWGRPPGRMLEIGVGEGFSLDYFARRGWEVVGMDFTDDGLKAFFPALADKLLLGDAFELLDKTIASGDQYDLVICNNVLEHVIDPVGLLTRLHVLMKPNGMVRIAVPNDNSWLQAEIVRRGHADAMFWVAAPDHLNYFNTDTLPMALVATGWTVPAICRSSRSTCFFSIPTQTTFVIVPSDGIATLCRLLSKWRSGASEGSRVCVLFEEAAPRPESAAIRFSTPRRKPRVP